jgi:hypothetical protein
MVFAKDGVYRLDSIPSTKQQPIMAGGMAQVVELLPKKKFKPTNLVLEALFKQQSTCLASTKPWVQTSRKKQNKKKIGYDVVA